jgi:hypothetical protein
VNQPIESKNEALVLEAFDTLFNKRDYAAAERFWSPDYIQHSAHIAPGREGLFNLVRSAPAALKYELNGSACAGCWLVRTRDNPHRRACRWSSSVIRQDGELSCKLREPRSAESCLGSGFEGRGIACSSGWLNGFPKILATTCNGTKVPKNSSRGLPGLRDLTKSNDSTKKQEINKER